MSNRFINDHKVGKVEISKILKITAGGIHCWCKSNVGRIRKPNSAIPESLWFDFLGLPKPEEKKEDFKVEIIEKGSFKLGWWQKLWQFIIRLFKR